MFLEKISGVRQNMYDAPCIIAIYTFDFHFHSLHFSQLVLGAVISFSVVSLIYDTKINLQCISSIYITISGSFIVIREIKF